LSLSLIEKKQTNRITKQNPTNILSFMRKLQKLPGGKKDPQFVATMNASAPPPPRILYDKLVIAREK
jgi:hypothetical protein